MVVINIYIYILVNVDGFIPWNKVQLYLMHTEAYVSVRQCTSAYVRIRQDKEEEDLEHSSLDR